MNKENVDKLVQLRQFVIDTYKQQIDGASAPATAVMKQQDVAHVYETVIRSLEDLLSKKVNFN
tara:strand:- start:100 stop:288 length:189 start_codon:yes stop_codon:yes gene_type:complete